ncbi:MAG: hypothetical protein COB12_09420 [Flavobacterium sp.]|nr:MAG: hypothetical protein COB12_09420 [Flavobacterium sp.]
MKGLYLEIRYYSYTNRYPQFEKIMRTIIILFFSILIVSCGGDDFHNLGVYQAKQGNFEKAIEYFSKAIEKNPKDAEAYYSRAHSQQTIGGNEEQIISDYTSSLKFNPNDNEAYMNRGVAKMKIGQNSEAISDYKKAIELNPNYDVVYANLGNAYKLNNNNDKACLNWKKSLNLGNESVRQRISLNCK